MDTLTNKIDEIDKLEKKNKELGDKKKELQRKITDGENEILKIIKEAIEKIVKDNTIILDNFKEQSLKKISEIIKNKKALIKEQEDIDTKEKEICDKKKEYILLYIKSEGIKENKVIDYYTDSNTQQSTDVSYIIYINNNKNIIYTQKTIDRGVDFLKIPIDISQKDKESDIHKYELNKTYERIKTNQNEIRGDIKINII